MKRLSLLIIVALASVAIFAQNEERGRKITFEKNGFWDNWFIGAGPGTNVYFGEWDQEASFFSRPSLNVTAQVGKWINPYLGVRAKGSFGSLHSFVGEDATTMLHQRLATGEFDFLFDVTNYFGKYKENRVYHFIPFVGIGAAFGTHARIDDLRAGDKKRSITANAGIINKFRITKKFDIDLEVAGAFLRDDFDHDTSGKDWSYDGLLSGSVNFIYKLGKSDFSKANLRDQGELDGLNNEINRLRAENDLLSKRPKGCPDCPEVKPVVKEAPSAASFVSNVVFFRLGSAQVDKHQEVSIHNTAEYLKQNTNAKVKIVGYADKKTGSASVNQKLSEKRAKNVADALINKYGISSNRVSVDWKGDTVQPYAENDWNRVAIFYAD